MCPKFNTGNTVKHVNKDRPRERQNMVFIDKWFLFGCHFVNIVNGKFSKCGFSLQGGLYSEEVFNTDLTV